MNVNIKSSGDREHVKQDVAKQIAEARRDHPTANPVIAAIGDEIARRMRNAPGSQFSVTADLSIAIDVLKATAADLAEPFVMINGERITQSEFDRMARENAKKSAPFIGTPAAGPGELISSDD